MSNAMNLVAQIAEARQRLDQLPPMQREMLAVKLRRQFPGLTALVEKFGENPQALQAAAVTLDSPQP